MVTDEDLESVSGGKGGGCKHPRDIIICRRYDFLNQNLSFEEVRCAICSKHKIWKYIKGEKYIGKDWFEYSGTSWLDDHYDGNNYTGFHFFD